MRSARLIVVLGLSALILLAAASPAGAQPPKARTYMVAFVLNQGPGAVYPFDSTLFDCWRFTKAGNLVPRYWAGGGSYYILETVGSMSVWQGEVRYKAEDGRIVLRINMATAEWAFAGSSIAGTAIGRIRESGSPWFSFNGAFVGVQVSSMATCLAAVEDMIDD